MAVATAPVSSEHGLPPHKWLIAVAVMLGTVLEVLDSTIMNVALPHMQGAFSASVDEIAWVLTSYFVANGIMIPMTGWISSRVGRKRYFIVSILTFVCASALCGAAQSLGEMVIFRLIQGTAGAAMLPSSQAILMESFPPHEQQLAMATWGLGLNVAPIMGPTLGGWLTDNLNWRWTFYINVPIGIIAAIMVAAFVFDPPYLRGSRSSSKVDYFGIACLVISLGIGQLVLDRGERMDWFSSPTIVWATITASLAAIFLVVQELRFSDPIIDIRIFKKPVFTLCVLLMVAMSIALFGSGLLIPVFLQDYMGYDALKAGLVVAPRGIATIFSMFFVGQMARRGKDTRTLIGLGYFMMALSLWTMASWDLSVGIWEVITPGIEMGIGMGLIFPGVTATAFATIPREGMGYASSLFNMTRNTGAAVGISYVTTMLLRREQTHQSYLVQHFSVFDAWNLGMAPPRMPGAPQFHYLPQIITGQKQGLDLLYGSLRAQAAMLSFNDIYRTLAIMMAVLIPCFILLRRMVPHAESGTAGLH